MGHIDLPNQHLYSVTVENVTVEVLIEEGVVSPARELIGMTPHTHAYIELFACLSGRITISSERGDIALNAGDIAVISDHLRHMSRKETPGSDYRAVGMRFIRRSARNGVNLYRRLSSLCAAADGVLVRGRPSLCACVAALSDLPGQEECLPALRLTMLLLEIADAGDKGAAASGNALSDRDLNRISRLDYLINSCFMTPLTAESVAEQLFVSQRQLSRIVRKRYGTSLHQAVTEKRVHVAARMLDDPSRPVADIAQAVGFGSVHSLYRAFSAYYGLSPQEYRRRFAGQSGREE